VGKLQAKRVLVEAKTVLVNVSVKVIGDAMFRYSYIPKKPLTCERVIPNLKETA